MAKSEQGSISLLSRQDGGDAMSDQKISFVEKNFLSMFLLVALVPIGVHVLTQFFTREEIPASLLAPKPLATPVFQVEPVTVKFFASWRFAGA